MAGDIGFLWGLRAFFMTCPIECFVAEDPLWVEPTVARRSIFDRRMKQR
jgi:hypothetical protein